MQLRQSRMGDGCGKVKVSGNYEVGFMELPKRVNYNHNRVL